MRKILDILGIALPALIIVISLFRPSLKNITQKAARARIINSVVMFLLVLMLLAGIIRIIFFPGNGGRHKGPDPVPLAVSKHSPEFNQSVQSLLDAYYNMSEAFVNWDSVKVNQHAAEVTGVLNTFKLDELINKEGGTVDSTIYQTVLDPFANAKAANDNILNTASLDKKRSSFNDLSDNIRQLFIIVKYDANKVYWQECPMAFGDGVPGFWLSKTDEVRNPYMGLYHPEHKGDMLKCGGPKDTINFMVPDSLRK